MRWEEVFSTIFHFSFWTLVKFWFLVGFAVYIIFALVLLRQVYMMTKVVANPLNPLIKAGAWIHLAIAIAVFWLAAVGL